MTEYKLSEDMLLQIAPGDQFTLVQLWKWNEDTSEWDTVYSRLNSCGTYFEYALDALCAAFPDVSTEDHEYMLNCAGIATEWADDYATLDGAL